AASTASRLAATASRSCTTSVASDRAAWSCRRSRSASAIEALPARAAPAAAPIAMAGDPVTAALAPSTTPMTPGTMPKRSRRSISSRIGSFGARIKGPTAFPSRLAACDLCASVRFGQARDVGHDPAELEVLRRVHRRDAETLQLGLVIGRDDPADDHRRVHALLAEEP